MRFKKSVYGFCLSYCSFFAVFAEDDFSKIKKEMQDNPPAIAPALENISTESEPDEFNPYLKLNKDGILVYIFSPKNSDFATFKAVTHVRASLDSILAVMLDNKSCTQWVDACENSFLIKKISFNERYHYQIFDTPFPFINRDFIFHSTMKYKPENNEVTIQMSSEHDYCKDKQSEPCKQVNQSKLVRVIKSIGTFKLQTIENGTKITWIQHMDPAGSLPAWLVNYFVKNTPYWTFKNLKSIVKEEKYKYAKLVYNNQGIPIALNMPVIKTKKPAKIADIYSLSPAH